MNSSALIVNISSPSLDIVTYNEMLDVLGCGLELNKEDLNTVLTYRYSLIMLMVLLCRWHTKQTKNITSFDTFAFDISFSWQPVLSIELFTLNNSWYSFSLIQTPIFLEKILIETESWDWTETIQVLQCQPQPAISLWLSLLPHKLSYLRNII